VLVAHSFGGMMLTQAGVAPNVTALVYIAARGPDAGEDYPALAKQFPAPPASAGLVTTDGYSRLNENAFFNDFANGVDPAKARVLYAVQQTNVATLPARRARLLPRGTINHRFTRSRNKTAPSIRTWNALWQSA
jgi:pimeloyl-ACP methyl ester carboxylesterase